VNRDRWAGVFSVGLAIAALAEATTFRVRFLTDPVGPRGFPVLAAVLLLAAGIPLVLDRAREVGAVDDAVESEGLPEVEEPGGPRVLRWGGLPHSAVLATALLAYAVLLPWLGFLLATVLALWATALLFEGGPVRGMVASAVVSVGLWLVFEWALGIYLPVGMLWGLGG
jgi:putative tricarboxylic transport membrane protein